MNKLLLVLVIQNLYKTNGFHERTNWRFSRRFCDFFIFLENQGYIAKLVFWRFWESIGKWMYTQFDNWHVISIPHSKNQPTLVYPWSSNRYKTSITSSPYQAGIASSHTSLVGSLLPILIPGAGLYANLYTRPTLVGTTLIQSWHPWEILHCRAVNQIWLATKTSMGLFTWSGRPFCCQRAQISFPPSIWERKPG